MSMYGRNNSNIFNKGPSNTSSSGNIFSRNASSTNPTNPYANNNSYNNASYNSSYNNSNGNSNSSIGDVGSYRVADYKPGQPPRSLEDINLKWKSPDLNPVSIAVRPETMHLSVVELRNEDYCLIRRQKASNQIQKAIEEVLRKKCFNQNLLNSHIVSTMKDPETLRQGPISMDVLKSYRNRPVYGSSSNININQGYSSNTAGIFNRNNNSNTSGIFGGNNTSNNNSSNIFGSNNNNNNTGNSSGGNIFGSRNNNTSGNIFGNNGNSNMNSSSTNGIFGSNSNRGNIFGNNNVQNSSSSNIFSSNNNNMNTSKNMFGNNNTNNTSNNNNNSSGNNIFSSNNNNSSNNNMFNNNNNNNNFGNRSNTNSSNNNIFGNNQNSNSNNGKNLFNNGNNNGNNLFSNQHQQPNPTNTLINQYAFMKIAENNNQLIQALMQHQQKQLVYTRNSPLTNLYGINHLPHLFDNPILPNSNSNPNSFFNGPYPSFPSHSLSNTSSHDDPVDETRYNQNMTESLNPKVQRLLHQSLNPYKASNHVLIHTKLRQNPTENRQDYPDTQQQLHNHSRITHSQLRFNQDSSNDVTNMFQPTKSQFVPQKSQHYHPRQTDYRQDSIIQSSERNFFQSNHNQSTLNHHHMPERNQQSERQTLSRNFSETRKFNLPEGYYCKFKSFDHRQVENLEIGNEFGKIYWPGKFCVSGMDLDGKFQILPNTVNSTVNQLNRKCYVTFFSVPEGLQQADEETAKESLKEFLEQKFRDKILLQMFSLNPPEYRIEIKELSEFRGITEFDHEEQARVQEI